MASEKDFELLDDYLSNRLDEQDKASFEEQLQSDPELKRELEFQQNLVDGIRHARMSELKALLISVPVSSIPSGHTSLIAKVGAVAVVGGMIATGLYYYLDNNNAEPAQTKSEQVTTAEPEIVEPAIADESTEAIDAIPVPTEGSEAVKKSQPKTETSKPAEQTAVTKPKIDVYDPTTEPEQKGLDPQEQIDIISHAFVTSSMEVVIDSSNKSFSFHYMFKDKKLMLYGIRENDLYEILEFIYDEKQTVFLFYKSNYYWLDLAKDEPTRLTPIRDRQLLQKLKDYRNN